LGYHGIAVSKLHGGRGFAMEPGKEARTLLSTPGAEGAKEKGGPPRRFVESDMWMRQWIPTGGDGVIRGGVRGKFHPVS